MTAIRNNILPSGGSSASAKEAEAKLLEQWLNANRMLLDVLLDAYCIVDTANNVVDFNTAFTDLCGESYRKIKKIGNFCELIKTELCPGQCPSKQIVTSGQPLRLDELKGSSKAFPELHLILGGVPVLGANKELLGSLITIRDVTAENELQKKYGERKKESVTDGLTRLYNKVYTETTLVKFLMVAHREGTPLSVCMVDIDHFKKVNDTFGHQAGDYVLSLVAQLLQGESRDSDIAGRFGGEEFMVILPNTDVPGAFVFAERFRKHVEQTKIQFEGKPIPVTVSLGTATFSKTWPDGEPNKEIKELVSRADAALYSSKANGRNRTLQFENLPAPESKPVLKIDPKPEKK